MPAGQAGGRRVEPAGLGWERSTEQPGVGGVHWPPSAALDEPAERAVSVLHHVRF